METLEKVRHFRDLKVWNKARALTLDIYKHTKSFPREEAYGLTSQIRRASVSIACNIAEGSKRRTSNDLCHFLTMAQGSTEEVKCLLVLSEDLMYLRKDDVDELYRMAEEVGAMLNGLLTAVRRQA